MTADPDRTLNAAMARLQRGDRSAFEPVFDAAWPRVLAWCARALPNHADAEDAAQRALERVFEQASEYDPRRSGLAWVLAIASWEVRTLRTRQVRAQRRERPIDEVAERPSTHPDDDPEALLVSADLLSEAELILRGLSLEDQQLVDDALHGRAGDSTIAPATLRKRRQRAMDRLRSAWRALHGH